MAGTRFAGWTLADGITYHPGGMWAEIRHANGIADRQGRDPGFRPRPGWLETRQLGQVLWKPGTLSYDAAGNILTIGASEGGGTDRFAYDGVSRLKQARMYVPQREPESLSLLRDGFETGDHSRWAPWGIIESIPNYEIEVLLDYTFDEHGNLLSWSKGGVSRPQPTDGATNHLTRGTFDAAGNLTILDDPGVQGDRVTFSFDALNRIVARQGETDAKPLYFLYTADDERTVTHDPEPSHQAWLRFTLRNFDGKLIRTVREAPGNALVADEDVIFRGDQPLAKVGSNDVLAGMHLSLDHLGSVRTTTNGDGTLVARRKYYPFGEEATPFFEQAAIALKYTGHERDAYDPAATGDDRDYMHARFASPITGRFLSVDRAAADPREPQTWNRYAYVAGNPMSFADPNGALRLRANFSGMAAWNGNYNYTLTFETRGWLVGESFNLVGRALGPLGRWLGAAKSVAGKARDFLQGKEVGTNPALAGFDSKWDAGAFESRVEKKFKELGARPQVGNQYGEADLKLLAQAVSLTVSALITEGKIDEEGGKAILHEYNVDQLKSKAEANAPDLNPLVSQYRSSYDPRDPFLGSGFCSADNVCH